MPLWEGLVVACLWQSTAVVIEASGWPDVSELVGLLAAPLLSSGCHFTMGDAGVGVDRRSRRSKSSVISWPLRSRVGGTLVLRGRRGSLSSGRPETWPSAWC